MFKRKIFIPVYFIIFAYLAIGLLLFTYQNSFFYPANKTDFATCSQFQKAEKIAQGDFRGYFIKRSSEKVVIYYHGNGGRACDRHYRDPFFEYLGYSVLYVEYPGYAEPENETTMKKILDEVKLVDDFIKDKNFKEVIAVGESVGSGPASYQTTLPDNEVTKLILITPYDNMANVAALHYPVYPMGILVRNNFRPDLWLKNVHIPVTLILAENDEVVGLEQGKKLAEIITSKNKEVYTVKDVGHNSIYYSQEFSDLFVKVLSK